jgi:hypothetical protein
LGEERPPLEVVHVFKGVGEVDLEEAIFLGQLVFPAAFTAWIVLPHDSSNVLSAGR